MKDTALEPHTVAARVGVEVYVAADGTRWRIRSAARGKRVIADSGQGYANKADAFRGLLLTTGGAYTRLYHHTYKDGVYEQGSIVRHTPEGVLEDIFVQDGREVESTSGLNAAEASRVIDTLARVEDVTQLLAIANGDQA